MGRDPLAGEILGHYRVVDRIGAGGMGVVYRAHDERLDRFVALKILPAGALVDADSRKSFQSEAQVLAKLNHPNIATIYDFDSDSSTDFLVMELLTGETVAQKLSAGPLPLDQILKFGAQMAAGIAAAHQQGILHRDLKPGNLGLTADGRLKILDFGIAKLLESDPAALTRTLTGAGMVKGTLPYMAPEQLRAGGVDARTDIYAVGVVLYEMAAGKLPYPQLHTAVLIDNILNHPPPLPTRINRAIPPGLEAVIVKAMDKDPSHRYQSAAELMTDLERLTTASTPVAAQQAFRRKLQKRTLIASAIAIALVLVAGAWFVLQRLQWRTRMAGQPVLLIGDFENRTQEAAFTDTLREMFAATLQQSRHVSVFPQSSLVDVLHRMGRPPTQPIDEAVGQEICQREGLQGLLLGSITKLGNKYVLVTRLESPSGAEILSAEKSAVNADDIPSRVDEIAESMRRSLGESLQSVKENSVPLARVTSSSLEAIRYFTLGKQSLYSGDIREAVVLFKRAIELDPKFAMAHEYLGITYEQSQDYDGEVEQLHQAALLADQVSEPERDKILGDYYATIRDFQKGCAYYRVLIRLQPLDPAPYINLGRCYQDTFDYPQAIAYTQKALRFVPQSRVRINLASQLFLQGDTQQALQIAEGFSQEYATEGWAQHWIGQMYLALGRLKDARKTFQAMTETQGDGEVEGHLSLADVDLATGAYRDAQAELKAALLAADKYQNPYLGARARLASADSMLLARAPVQQVRQALSGANLTNTSPDLVLLFGIAYAAAGDLPAAREQARAIDATLKDRDFPAIRAAQYLLAAEIALAQRKFAESVDAAQKAVFYQNSSFAAETLARCYAAAGDYQQAAQQYETVLTRASERSSAAFDNPAFRRVVLAHYQLGVLYQKLGRLNDSRSHLEKFLGYWSHPDADLDLYKDAQRRLRTLPAGGTPTAAR
jgi:tetratricopeptide (TPR) repeat protein/predicted Ser/Thr protein kinase